MTLAGSSSFFCPRDRPHRQRSAPSSDPEDLDLLGVWDWLRVLFEQWEAFGLQFRARPAWRSTTSPRSGGCSPGWCSTAAIEFITPSLPVTLTHAVQQPLGLPTWTRLPIVHQPGVPGRGGVPVQRLLADHRVAERGFAPRGAARRAADQRGEHRRGRRGGPVDRVAR